MKILNIKGVKTISKSNQKSISGGIFGVYEMCMDDCNNRPNYDSVIRCFEKCARFLR